MNVCILIYIILSALSLPAPMSLVRNNTAVSSIGRCWGRGRARDRGTGDIAVSSGE